MNRLWLGDRLVAVGDILALTGGYTGPAVVVAIRPIRDIDEGALLIDPRTLQLVQCAGCDSHGACFIAYPGSILHGCATPGELFPVIALDPARPAPDGDAEHRNP
ncbi:hypothetical protein [Dactylosporangium sp. NPDC049140]|uniref:hypothetical protein n=1 Tax=Dactylosporangium sp. NPDC049140 TaxID=3155647 RepID=UPI0033EE255A